ncbi:MAG: glycoside hydrolase 43 family protein [Odoribacter sp.]|nr:glycoside hydrolase 43 family protein [Odoribacter sp.]
MWNKISILKQLSFITLLTLISFSGSAQEFVSKAWVSDLGNGKYKNPIINADYSDPDVCRVGDDYYMTASSFNCIPGLPILHSKDMVNWTLINHAVKKLIPEDVFNNAMHGDGIWAPSIRYHNEEFYIYYGDPDYGIYMTKTKDPAGDWEPLVLVKPGKGLIDACPLWDDKGNAWLVHAYAGSRAGFKSVLAVAPLSLDGMHVLDESRIIYDGNGIDETIEGPKFYQKDGYYYIFAPAGGVSTGWQVVLRSDNPYGPYERKVVLAQGKSPVNGPHQGAWVDTPTGEDWFFHFQDKGVIGRVVHLQPMVWKNGFPVIGEDKNGDGCGQPVMTYKKPNVGRTYPIATPVDSDEFTERTQGLQWQWHGNASPLWAYHAGDEGYIRLFSVYQGDNYKNLWDVPNLYLQKFPTDEFTAVTKLTFVPQAKNKAERTGLVVMGQDYGLVVLQAASDGFELVQATCLKAERGTPETVNKTIKLKENTVWLQVKVSKNYECQFSYSLDGKKFQNIGKPFKAKEGKWIGAKVGIFNQRPVSSNVGGWADYEFFRISAK